jgi:hypothetical protein
MVIDFSERKGPPHVWCRFCGAWAKIQTPQNSIVERRSYTKVYEKREPEIAAELVVQLEADLAGREAFFTSRGLTPQTIQRYRLGFHRKYHRYAIPCFVDGKLYGIKYRIDPEREKYLKKQGKSYSKYISEKGGVNNVVFNIADVRRDIPFVLIDEGEIDTMLLTQHGFPTICPFSGNNSGMAWRPEWMAHIRHIPSIYVIAQNDEPGELIAISRLHDIGRGRIVRAPEGYKDFGEWLRSIAPQDRTRELVQRLSLLPVLEEK